MKLQKLYIFISLLFLTSCGASNNTTSNVELPTDVNPDVTALFIQACPNKDTTCKQLLCNKADEKFICSDNPLGENKNCSEEQTYDEILTGYKICSEDASLLTYQVFNYSEKKNDFFTSMTPTELEAKIAQETQIIEEGGESKWMGSFLAGMGGALLGGIIANQIFGNKSAQVPQRPNNIENNRTINKESLNQTKQQSKTETEKRVEKRKAEFKKRVDAAKAKINAAKNKKTSTKRKSSGRRRR